MKRSWGFWCCCAGDALFIASLGLPSGIDRTGNGLPSMPGWMAFLIGCYWYPSNLALILSPVLFSRSMNATVPIFFGAFLLLTFVFTIWFLLMGMEVGQVAVGFYVWVSAFAVSVIGLVGSAFKHPAQNPDATLKS
jgi:hypothetical protein